jgi:hypothetical protein
MISYSHASKPLCLDIYNCLINDGYNVWFDLEQMHGSILVAMAKGIDDSDIILYCVTEKYSQSTNCQKEAEYAFIQQKIMIPLLLQSKYKPIGWLGLLLGATLYIDFTKNDFTQNYQQLKREVEANAIRINSNQNEVAKLILDSTTDDKEHSQNVAENPPPQSTKTNSVAIKKQSRSCILF